MGSYAELHRHQHGPGENTGGQRRPSALVRLPLKGVQNFLTAQNRTSSSPQHGMGRDKVEVPTQRDVKSEERKEGRDGARKENREVGCRERVYAYGEDVSERADGA